MKQKLITLLFTLLLSGIIPQIEAEQIEWMTSYDEALHQAKETTKPIVLFFTGSDWCTWCHKLENESLQTPEFAQSAGKDFIFLKLDFPMKKGQDSKVTEQNKGLQQKFSVRSFPSIIVLDANGDLVGATGYRPGGGRQYGEHLKNMVEEYSLFQ